MRDCPKLSSFSDADKTCCQHFQTSLSICEHHSALEHKYGVVRFILTTRFLVGLIVKYVVDYMWTWVGCKILVTDHTFSINFLLWTII